MSQARGVIILCAVMNNVKLYEYTPLQVKQAVVGYGRAEKKQVITMKKILCISLVLVMMLSFAACSTNTDTNDTVSADNATPSTTEPETTTLEAPEGFALFQDKEVAVGYPSDWTKANDTTFTNVTATITVETQDKTDYYSTLDTSKYVQKAKDELYDKYLRTLAEYDNFRKRSQREKDAIYGDATTEAVKKLLPVLDNFERALNYECKDEEFKKGISLIQNTLVEVFDNLGVKEILAMDQQFDPNLHEAVMHIEDESVAENTVTQVLQKGYKIGSTVIRPAMVQVAN